MSGVPRYVLGGDEAEIARLDGQAATLARATGILLRAAGIGDGMRVLDLGTGLGHVAFAVAALVGPRGEVVGLDQSESLLAVAEHRRVAGGWDTVRFVEGDARTFRDERPFDAVVARLLLFHLPDAGAVVRHNRAALGPGGVMLALDFDAGAARSHPPVPAAGAAYGWVEAAFTAAGADPRIGARLLGLLRDAGLVEATALGLQPYFAADDPQGPALVGGVLRALAPQIVAAGIATAAELDVDGFEQRLTDELMTAGAVLLPPALVGAWAHR